MFKRKIIYICWEGGGGGVLTAKINSVGDIFTYINLKIGHRLPISEDKLL